MSNTRLAISASGIRDNLNRGSLGQFLQEKIRHGSKLSVVSAYFTVYAYGGLKKELDDIQELRFLFGEPRFVSSLDPSKTDKKAFGIEDTGLVLRNRLQQRQAAKECAEWIQEKVEIRSIKRANLLHGKMYHIANGELVEAIVGSSNFTVSGLGLNRNGHNNIELNLEVNDNRDRKDLLNWFDELWHNKDLVEDVKDEVLLYLAQLYQNHPPEFIYFKTLFHLFEQYLEEQAASGLLAEQAHLYDTQIWKTLFEFQKDGVTAAINKILIHSGCIIADSVGLGKTFEALAIIKYFELRNDRVLVLCPKKLRENWTVYQAHNNSALNPFVEDRFTYTVLSHTDLSRSSGKSGDIDLATINWGNYDLVVIDESHNFRNNSRGRRDDEGNIIRKSRYERLMDDIIRSGRKTKVLLLSATPVNNDLKDLRNQLYFITEGRNDAFRESMGIDNLQDTLAAAQRTFNEWVSESKTRDTRLLLDKLSSAFFKLLDELTIARSRKHIQRYYADTMAELGGFPARAKPLAIFPEIDLKQRFMSYDRLNEEISKYRLAVFNPFAYVLPEYRHRYEEGQTIAAFTQSRREHYLIGMMKVNFLKRLESSIEAFRITMARTLEKIERLLGRIDRYQALEADAEFDLDLLDLESLEDEELQAALQVGAKFKYQMAHLDLAAWARDLREDLQQIDLIYSSATGVSPDRDGKLAELKQLIADKIAQPTTNNRGQPNRKVLIFTAFADTAGYLYQQLRGWAKDELGIHSAMVTGGTQENKTTFGRNQFQDILVNFSPIAKRRAQMPDMPQDAEIDLLIATDCISEGQNLQDCDFLVNYDIHWNPVRIIQRFGRIDRIGSLNPAVRLINFWPTPDLNKYINLKNRVEARMALVDIAATMEDNLLAPEQIQAMIEDELTYRDKQLLRLKDEILDLEDFTESVALNAFTLDDFRIELLKYLDANRQALQDAPFGLYAVVPTRNDIPQIEPGVIYCLKQKGNTGGTDTVNPLQPYFLVYVWHDKTVRFGFAQPKQILDIFRELCMGQSRPYEELCHLFDVDTHNGADMDHYNELLERAVVAIERTFKQRAAGQLVNGGRSGILIDQSKQASKHTDFDLITWLVIR